MGRRVPAFVGSSWAALFHRQIIQFSRHLLLAALRQRDGAMAGTAPADKRSFVNGLLFCMVMAETDHEGHCADGWIFAWRSALRKAIEEIFSGLHGERLLARPAPAAGWPLLANSLLIIHVVTRCLEDARRRLGPAVNPLRGVTDADLERSRPVFRWVCGLPEPLACALAEDLTRGLYRPARAAPMRLLVNRLLAKSRAELRGARTEAEKTTIRQRVEALRGLAERMAAANRSGRRRPAPATA